MAYGDINYHITKNKIFKIINMYEDRQSALNEALDFLFDTNAFNGNEILIFVVLEDCGFTTSEVFAQINKRNTFVKNHPVVNRTINNENDCQEEDFVI
ncbi:MAG: hypothetical protein IJW59_03305 [Clostridia bacterium]|nr:hypothetical protein [Clostridia bacterium]